MTMQRRAVASPASSSRRRRLDLVGAGAACCCWAPGTWQTVVHAAPRRCADDVLRVTGRTVDAAPTALALVALAGVVAVLATRGLVARGVVGARASRSPGSASVWRAVAAMSALSARAARRDARAGDRHRDGRRSATAGRRWARTPAWPVLRRAVRRARGRWPACCVAARGAPAGPAMSARYDGAAAGAAREPDATTRQRRRGAR